LSTTARRRTRGARSTRLEPAPPGLADSNGSKALFCLAKVSPTPSLGNAPLLLADYRRGASGDSVAEAVGWRGHYCGFSSNAVRPPATRMESFCGEWIRLHNTSRQWRSNGWLRLKPGLPVSSRPISTARMAYAVAMYLMLFASTWLGARASIGAGGRSLNQDTGNFPARARAILKTAHLPGHRPKLS
jgi:hypothetical protein